MAIALWHLKKAPTSFFRDVQNMTPLNMVDFETVGKIKDPA